MDMVQEGLLKTQNYNIVFLTNNDETLILSDWIKKQKNTNLFIIKEKLIYEKLVALKPALIISYGYKYIIKEEIINYFAKRVINLHIALLPYNKGLNPNFWSFVEDTPKGVTIHLVDKQIDTGDILFQREIEFDEEKETLASSYFKLQYEIQKLFKDNWQTLISFNYTPRPQFGKGTYHSKKDFENVSYLLGKKIWDISIVELKKKYFDHVKKQEKNENY